MPPDPLTSPLAYAPARSAIAALTAHPVLSTEKEAILIATLRAGVAAQTVIGESAPADPVLLHQAALGEEARATLVRHNMRLVVALAKRHLPLAGSAFTLDDLISLGCVGLLRGIDKFDPSKSGKLSTYATARLSSPKSWWIRQSISRGIAEEGRVIDLPVHLHDRLRQLQRARSQLAQQLGRAPTPEELAAHLGWSVARVAQLELVGQEVRSLNARLHTDDDGSKLGDMLPDQRFDPAATTLDASLRHDVAATLARLLNDRERRFLRAYFGFERGDRLTLEAIGAAEGLTRERVRQVIAGALTTLRADPLLRSYADEEGA